MSEQAPPPYSPGLAGVIAGESAICWVDPQSGLRYRGYDVEALATHPSIDFEHVAWLLLHGELPTPAELADFRRGLTAARHLPTPMLDILRRFPKTTRSMDLLRTGTSLLASFDPDVGRTDHDSNQRKAMRAIASMTALTTDGWQIIQGREIIDAPPTATLAERFLRGLSPQPPQWRTKTLDAVLILYAEHEFNASTFAARVTASTMPDFYSAIVSAIGALEGPLHGGANEEAMKMLTDIASPQNARDWVQQRLRRKEKIMGFGHRVYKRVDSRVPVMRKLLEDAGKRVGQTQWLAICQKLEEVMEQEKGLFANLDLYAAPVLHLLSIPTELNTPLFACSRIAGWSAHVIEQQDHNRLIRPRCLYTGPPARELP